MDDKRYDEIEKLMRSRLLDDAEAENKWNVPPDQIFDSAMASLPPRKKNRILLWIPIFLGVAVLGGLFYFMSARINALDTELQALKSEENLESKHANELSLTPPADNSSTKSAHIENEADNHFVRPDNQIQSATSRVDEVSEVLEEMASTTVTNRNEITQGKENKAAEKSELVRAKNPGQRVSEVVNTNPSDEVVPASNIVSSPAFVDEDEAEEPGSILRSAKSIDFLNRLNMQTLKVDDYRLAIDMISEGTAPLLRIDDRDDRKWTLGMFAGVQLTTLSMTKDAEGVHQLSRYDDYYPSWQFGISASFPLSNRLHFATALDYSSFNSESRHSATMIYDAANEEEMMDGTVQYRTKVNVESPMYAMEEEAMFRVDQSGLEQGDVMQQMSDIKQHFCAVGLFAGLRYDLAKFNRFSLSINGGVRSQYMVLFKEELDLNLYKGSDHMYKSNKSFDSFNDDISRLNWSISASFDLNYQINQSLSAGLIFGYDHGLSSLRESRSNSDMQTFLRSARLSTGIQYSF